MLCAYLGRICVLGPSKPTSYLTEVGIKEKEIQEIELRKSKYANISLTRTKRRGKIQDICVFGFYYMYI